MSDPSLGGANINLDNLTEAEYDDLMLFVHRYDKRTGADLEKVAPYRNVYLNAACRPRTVCSLLR